METVDIAMVDRLMFLINKCGINLDYIIEEYIEEQCIKDEEEKENIRNNYLKYLTIDDLEHIRRIFYEKVDETKENIFLSLRENESLEEVCEYLVNNRKEEHYDMDGIISYLYDTECKIYRVVER